MPESTDPQVANDVRDRTRTARTRSRGKIVLGVLLVPALVALAVSLAAASYGERGAFAGPGSGDGELDTPQRAAVDLGSGHLFVADSGNDRIQVFEPQDGSGSYLAQFTDPAIDAPLGVAVDQADGSIYVSDADDVVKFDSAYAFDGSFTSPGATGPLAVDPTDGDLLVADQATNTVRRFDSDGTPDGAPAIDGSTSPSGAFTGLLDVAINSEGDVYVVDSDGPIQSGPGGVPEPTGHSRVERFSPDGSHEATLSPVGPNQRPARVAVNPSNDDVFVSGEQDAINQDSSATFHVFDGANSPTQELTLSAAYATVAGLAAAPARLYAVHDSGYRADGDTYGSVPGVVLIELFSAPDVAVDPVDPEAVGQTEATVTGTVDPNGRSTSWSFDYRKVGAASWTAVPGGGADGSDPVPVSSKIGGLAADSDYEIRLRASNDLGDSAVSPPPYQQLTTDPSVAPTAVTTSAGQVTDTRARLNGTVRTGFAETSYWFEWGTQDCAAHACASVPLGRDGAAGAGPGVVHVSRQLTGLQPQTTYHYRLVAENFRGSHAGEDRTFTTRQPDSDCPNAGRIGVGFLPACRAWELVSTPDKQGLDVVLDSNRSRAAGDGSAMGFYSLGGYADTSGVGIGSEYVAQRSQSAEPGHSGWATHGITPPQVPLPITMIQGGAAAPLYVGEFDDRLERGIHFTASPLTGDENVAGIANLYLRDDLRDPGVGDYRLLTTSVDPQPSPVGNPFLGQRHRPMLAGASPDLERIVFQSTRSLTDDAQPQPAGCASAPFPNTCRWQAYEWDGAALRLLSRVPDSPQIPGPQAVSCDDVEGPACVSADWAVPGSGADQARVLPNMVSDGSDGHERSLFTQPANAAGLTFDALTQTERNPFVSSSGVRSGKLFMRVDGRSTVMLNASERTSPEAFAPATLQGASVDGTKIFFTSTEALTDDAQQGPRSLYLYDASKPPTAPDNLTLVSRAANGSAPNVAGVVGESDDGDYVYFVSDGPHVDGQPSPPGGFGIYLWHSGETSYVGAASDRTELLRESTGFRSQSRLTPDGRHLLFPAMNGDGILSPTGGEDYDHGDCSHEFSAEFGERCRALYVYSADEEVVRCATCRPSGAPATQMASDQIRHLYGGDQGTWHVNHAISDDGRWVFFHTPEALTPEDRNGPCESEGGLQGISPCTDVYSYDTRTGRVALLSSGTHDDGSYLLDASRDGRTVFLATRERLSGWDADRNYDVYAARVDGGFPEPLPAATPCADESGCKGTATPPPPAVAPGSEVLADEDSSGVASCRTLERRASSLTQRSRRLAGRRRALARRVERVSGSLGTRLERRSRALGRRAKRAQRAALGARREARECRRAAS